MALIASAVLTAAIRFFSNGLIAPSPPFVDFSITQNRSISNIDKANANPTELVARLNDFILGGAAGGRLVLSCESSDQVCVILRKITKFYRVDTI